MKNKKQTLLVFLVVFLKFIMIFEINSFEDDLDNYERDDSQTPKSLPGPEILSEVSNVDNFVIKASSKLPKEWSKTKEIYVKELDIFSKGGQSKKRIKPGESNFGNRSAEILEKHIRDFAKENPGVKITISFQDIHFKELKTSASISFIRRLMHKIAENKSVVVIDFTGTGIKEEKLKHRGKNEGKVVFASKTCRVYYDKE